MNTFLAVSAKNTSPCPATVMSGLSSLVMTFFMSLPKLPAALCSKVTCPWYATMTPLVASTGAPSVTLSIRGFCSVNRSVV